MKAAPASATSSSWTISCARAADLPFVYLGYWVKGSPRMAYKTRYQPLEALTARGWVPFTGEGHAPIAPPPVETAAEAGEA